MLELFQLDTRAIGNLRTIQAGYPRRKIRKRGRLRWRTRREEKQKEIDLRVWCGHKSYTVQSMAEGSSAEIVTDECSVERQG